MYRFASALLLLLSLTLAGTARAQVSQEFAVLVDPGLLDKGVHATVAAVPPESAQPPEGPVVLVFVTYEQAFHGSLYVRGLGKDGAEIARSRFVEVSEEAESGGHVRFPFERHARLADAARFLLEGDKAPPVPAEKSAGETAREIVRELLQ